MKPLRLDGVRNALIVAPHSDDEAIGAFGLIRALRARSARVRVVIASDGSGSHPNSARWPRARLVGERRRETRAVMHRVGVAAGDLVFLGLPDGALSRTAGAPGAIRRELARLRGCDLLVLPAADDDHPDHRVVAAALRNIAVRRLHYLVWPSRLVAPRRATHGLRLGEGVVAKRGAIARYRTQRGVITDDPGGFAISAAELAGFARPVERFREVRR